MNTKKLLGTTLSLAMILPSFANAADLFKNLKLDGQIDVQAMSSRNILDMSTRANLANLNASGGTTTNNDRLGNTQTRLMLGLDWDLLDDVHAKVSLTKNDRTWGTAGDGAANPATSPNSQTITAPGANVLGSVVVDQAYFKVDKVGGQVDTTIGRQYYGTAGDLVIYFGPSDKAEYGLPTNAIDAAKFDWSSDKVSIEGLAGEFTGAPITGQPKTNIVPGAANVAPTANIDVTGLIASIKATDQISGSLYTWNKLTHGTGAIGSDPNALNGGTSGKNDSLFITGGRVKYEGGGAWFKGEFDKNWGDNRIGGDIANTALSNSMRYKGWAVLTDLGYKADVAGAGAITGWGNFGYGTGQHDAHSNEARGFQSIAGDYRPGAIYGRFAPYTNGNAQPVGLGGNIAATGNVATNSLTNRVITGLGLKFNPSALSKLTVGVSAWDFHTQTAFAPVNPQGGQGLAAQYTVANGQSLVGGNKHIGYETDVDVSWKHSDNVWFDVTAGRFMPGGALAQAVQSGSTNDATARSGNGLNPAVLAAFDCRVKF